MAGQIRVGIGGWTFPPWRGVFYPQGWRHADELAFASRKVTAIEINATYHSLQTPEVFAKWAKDTPEDFLFTVKASRLCTNRKVLSQVGEPMQRFLGQGLTQLGARLGPILWQFMATKRFEPDDFAAFLALLPARADGLVLRHCVEVRHPSFADPTFVTLCRNHGVAICLSESEAWPLIADVTADFVYARLMRGDDAVETAYPPADLDRWAERLQAYAQGGAPADLPAIAPPKSAAGRDVFAFFIRSGKVRAPAAAMALLEKVS